MTDIIEELRAGAELEEAYDADGIIRTGYQRSLRWRAADKIERLRAEVVDVTRRLGQTRLRLVRAIEQIRSMPGADNETAYEMRKIAAEALGHE
jgi:hypothetical protein